MITPAALRQRFLAEPLTLRNERRDFGDWHRGRPHYLLWAIDVDLPAVRSRITAAQRALDGLLLDGYRRQPHITLALCGFPARTARPAVDEFDRHWLQARIGETVLPPADVQATLLDLTARTVADALQMTQPDTRRVLVCGGGVRNAVLMARLAAYLPQAIVESTAMHGLEPDYVEAMGFAWLARETLAGRPGNLPAVTGASGRRILGTVFPA